MKNYKPSILGGFYTPIFGNIQRLFEKGAKKEKTELPNKSHVFKTSSKVMICIHV